VGFSDKAEARVYRDREELISPPKSHVEHSFPIPLEKKNKATIFFDKLPVSKADLERLKDWINLMEAPLTEEDTGD
ncbi:MAG: hypothetical protein O6857_00545, partial [Nitrospinae bacterium]|nr:hypothetical protein [Nitrospinota bacterium]